MISLAIWGGIFIFSCIVMACVRDALVLSMMLSALNAGITALAGFGLFVSAVVFLISYGVLLCAVMLTSLVLKMSQSRRSVKSVQKDVRK